MDMLLDPRTGTVLTPSPQGRECLGNGKWPGYECCCDECNFFLECFPEHVELHPDEDAAHVVVPAVYNIPGNLRRKLTAYQKALDELKKMEWYYAPIFSRDPEVQELLQLLDGKIAQLKQQLESHYKALAECNPPENTEPDKEDGEPKALTYVEVLHLKHERVLIAHAEKGTWKDQARPVESFMDMNHLPLESGITLDLDEYGSVWVAYAPAV